MNAHEMTGPRMVQTRTAAMKRVYVVDDSASVRQRLIDLLAESESIRTVGQAGDAVTALGEIQTLSPDVVVLDIQLPGKSGLWLLGELKRWRPEIVVIIMTNYDYPQYRKQSIKSGADYFFNKAREFESILGVLTH